jgi:hypothetical protein
MVSIGSGGGPSDLALASQQVLAHFDSHVAHFCRNSPIS